MENEWWLFPGRLISALNWCIRKCLFAEATRPFLIALFQRPTGPFSVLWITTAYLVSCHIYLQRVFARWFEFVFLCVKNRLLISISSSPFLTPFRSLRSLFSIPQFFLRSAVFSPFRSLRSLSAVCATFLNTITIGSVISWDWLVCENRPLPNKGDKLRGFIRYWGNRPLPIWN